MKKMDNNKDNSENGDAFGVPSDFFEKSSLSIQNKIEWLEEMREYKMLESVRDQTIFQVPAGYFESSECSLELLSYSSLNLLKGQVPFAVPVDYFESFAEKLNEPILFSVGKANIFSVPENYFENNRKKIELTLDIKQNVKIIRLWKKPLQLAVAALFVIALGFWSYSHYFETQPAQDCNTIACIDRNELLQGKEIEELDDNELYDLVNAKLLEESLNSGKSAPPKNSDSTEEFSDEDLIDNI